MNLHSVNQNALVSSASVQRHRQYSSVFVLTQHILAHSRRGTALVDRRTRTMHISSTIRVFVLRLHVCVKDCVVEIAARVEFERSPRLPLHLIDIIGEYEDESLYLTLLFRLVKSYSNAI